MGWMVSTIPRPIYRRKTAGTHCGGGWMSPILVMHGCVKYRPHRDSIHGKTKIKTCLKVTRKYNKKNAVDNKNNLVKLKYLYFFLLFPNILTSPSTLTAGTECYCCT